MGNTWAFTIGKASVSIDVMHRMVGLGFHVYFGISGIDFTLDLPFVSLYLHYPK